MIETSPATCHPGPAAATADNGCFRDCDASPDPGRLPAVVSPVLDGAADLVLGNRRPTTWGPWSLHVRPARVELGRPVRRRTGLRLHDACATRAARREASPAPGPTDRRSGHPLQKVVRATDAGWLGAETDVRCRPRTGPKGTGPWRCTWQAVRDMRDVLAERPAATPAAPATTTGGIR
ncbi:glycosyltransferase [Streptomyces collinus]|uniref:glycosyltransferase n=1 Tax=Streptomyces collinus TaxID=42684 RepID=UPI003F4D52B8